MTISSKLLLENEVYGCSLGTPTTCKFKTITQCRIRILRADPNLAGNVEEPRIYSIC